MDSGNRSDQSCSIGTAGLLSMLGGAGLGAVLMYLFDPEEGKARRQELAGMAEDAYSRSGQVLGSTWESVRDHASRYGKASYAALSDFKDHLAEQSAHLSDHASDLADRARNSRYGRKASDHIEGLLKGRHHPGLEHGWSQALAAAGCIALGAGLMYLMDPADGARRRNTLLDKLFSSAKRTGRSMTRTGADLYNRTTGTLHEARSRMSREDLSDQVLEDRVRASIGHAITCAQMIRVEANNGCVTLSGTIPTDQVDPALKAVWSTRGVSELINHLNASDRYGNPLPREGSTLNSPMGAPPPNPTSL